jgi:hypothetical protein
MTALILPENLANGLENAKRGVLKVGDGRGFVVGNEFDRYVITAAHCLPELPPAIAYSDTGERTHRDLLGPIGGPCTVWAEVAFVDPVADIAVLCGPDGEWSPEHSDAYKELTEPLPTLAVADIAIGDDASSAWLLSLAGEWQPCKAKHLGIGLWIHEANNGIARGMSGSPVILHNGAAIGVVCTAAGSGDDIDKFTEGGPNARLAAHLPGWLLRTLDLKPNGGPLDYREWALAADMARREMAKAALDCRPQEARTGFS